MSGDEPLRERVEDAVRRVRREALKAATVHAAVYGVCALLVANLALTLVGTDLPGPWFAREAVAVAVGLLAAAVAFRVRTRRPLVEQFEAVNPEVAEALRTARDAARAGADSRVARRLYADVLDGLSRASSAQLIDVRRVGVAMALVLVASLATVQVGVVGIDLTPEPDVEEPTTPSPRENEFDGLADGDAILGDEEDVDAGENDRDAVIGGSAGGSEGVDTTEGSYETGGFADGGAFEAQEAGFSASDDVENADIIREYNLRIREDD